MSNLSNDLESFARAWLAKRRKSNLRTEPFCAEEITQAAIDARCAPQDLRHVGGTYARLAREGLMQRSQTAFKRKWGNHTLTLGWTV